MKLSTLFKLLPDEIDILEAGGWPMRVTAEEHKRIEVLASNFDQNHPLCKTCGAVVRRPHPLEDQASWEAGEAWCRTEKTWVYRTWTAAEIEATREWPKGSIMGNFERGVQTDPRSKHD